MFKLRHLSYVFGLLVFAFFTGFFDSGAMPISKLLGACWDSSCDLTQSGGLPLCPSQYAFCTAQASPPPTPVDTPTAVPATPVPATPTIVPTPVPTNQPTATPDASCDCVGTKLHDLDAIDKEADDCEDFASRSTYPTCVDDCAQSGATCTEDQCTLGLENDVQDCADHEDEQRVAIDTAYDDCETRCHPFP